MVEGLKRTTPKIMFVAGEASGDTHAARVIAALRERQPPLPIFGAGGSQMQAAGMELRLDLTEHAVVGLVEVLKNYGKFKCIFDDLLRDVERQQPAVVVLVDFPGFNLRFARAVKQRFPQTRIVYYISPQLWAWHASRARQIERDVDLMLTIFPFEKQWYAQHAPRLQVEFVGHPLGDRAAAPGPHPERSSRSPAFGEGEGALKSAEEAARISQNGRREKAMVLLLPGSREREVSKIFPIMSQVVDRLPPDSEVVAVAASPSLARLIRHPRVRVEVGNARQWMQRAAVAITASGTATMECAFAGCPMVVVYKVNWLTYLVGRQLVTVNWLAMPNVIAGREVVPEFIQYQARPAAIAGTVRELLSDPAKRSAMQRDLAEIVSRLGGPGAGDRAAELILELAGQPPPAPGQTTHAE